MHYTHKEKNFFFLLFFFSSFFRIKKRGLIKGMKFKNKYTGITKEVVDVNEIAEYKRNREWKAYKVM